MKILLATSELTPLVKTGGLADVSTALPRALRKLGLDVRILVPGYWAIKTGLQHITHEATIDLPGFPRTQILLGSLDGLPVYVVECAPLYERNGSPYADEHGRDWTDNGLRFALLGRVAALLGSNDSPISWRADIVHANDWQAGLAPAYLHFASGRKPAVSVQTIHNLAYPGKFDASLVGAVGLPPWCFQSSGVEFYGAFSFLKAGLYYANRITTVSPTYAQEIQGPAFGCGFEGLLSGRRSVLTGILNGIDDQEWNPATDRFLPHRFDAKSLDGKARNKAALQRRMGLEVQSDAPLFAIISRLTDQKGLDLACEVMGHILWRGGQVAILGSGDPWLQDWLRYIAGHNPGRVSTWLGYDEGLAHLMEAGADFFLMPSRFEPCGLNQMMSQRYGTLPIVHAVGGLIDTVEDGVTGFRFWPFSTNSYRHALDRAIDTFYQPQALAKMRTAAMARDFSWTKSALTYRDLYASMLG